jgi:hypothetical protein
VGCRGGVGAGATETPRGARDTGGAQVVLRILKILKLLDLKLIRCGSRFDPFKETVIYKNFMKNKNKIIS